jgi:hypothetical protein
MPLIRLDVPSALIWQNLVVVLCVPRAQSNPIQPIVKRPMSCGKSDASGAPLLTSLELGEQC